MVGWLAKSKIGNLPLIEKQQQHTADGTGRTFAASGLSVVIILTAG